MTQRPDKRDAAQEVADAIFKMVRDQQLNFFPSPTESNKAAVREALLRLLGTTDDEAAVTQQPEDRVDELMTADGVGVLTKRGVQWRVARAYVLSMAQKEEAQLTVDPLVLDLAEHLLRDEPFLRWKVHVLARYLQEVVEDWISREKSEAESGD